MSASQTDAAATAAAATDDWILIARAFVQSAS